MISARPFYPALVLILSTAACTTAGVGSSIPPGASNAQVAFPVTTSSSTAREQFLLGVRDMEAGRTPSARSRFGQAIAADPAFALGHLYSAFVSNTPGSYRAHLEHAERAASNASAAEQLRIQIERRRFANDDVGALELAQQLVRAAPNDPRALQILAAVQFDLGQTAEGRASLMRATQIAPTFAPAIIDLGNSYLTVEPRDLAQAEIYIRRAVALEPNEAYTHDFMGDVYRAQNRLQEARGEYTRMTELDPTRALAFQQRGHVNSFLGNWAEARADYDRSIALGEPGEKAAYGMARALVSVHSGDAAAAERELDQLVASIDGMNVPNATGAKIGALFPQLQIALHSGHLDVADRALDQLRTLWRRQAELGGTPEFERNRDANIAYAEGLLAAYKGDFGTARSKAQEVMRVVSPARNPRKNEFAHELLGMADLLQRNYVAATGHFAEADPNNLYTTYNHALALEGAGRTVEARALFSRVAATNFNNAGIALVKRDAARKASM